MKSLTVSPKNSVNLLITTTRSSLLGILSLLYYYCYVLTYRHLKSIVFVIQVKLNVLELFKESSPYWSPVVGNPIGVLFTTI